VTPRKVLRTLAAPRVRAVRRALAAVGTGAVLATFLVTGTSGVAQAATCSGTSEHIVKAVGTADLTWALCSDSSVQIWNGTIHDTLCDNRAANVRLVTSFEYSTTPTWVELDSSSRYKADGGCGTYESFPRVTLHPRSNPADCSGCLHRLQVQIYACSLTVGAPCSSTYSTNYYFDYSGGGGGCINYAQAPAARRYARIPSVIPC
jgi:hypothetical protein